MAIPTAEEEASENVEGVCIVCFVFSLSSSFDSSFSYLFLPIFRPLNQSHSDETYQKIVKMFWVLWFFLFFLKMNALKFLFPYDQSFHEEEHSVWRVLKIVKVPLLLNFFFLEIGVLYNNPLFPVVLHCNQNVFLEACLILKK